MFRLASVVCLIALFSGGCSSKGPGNGAAQDKKELLREVAGLVSAYTGEFKKGPQKLADLARYENGYPLGYEAVKSGEVVVVWGAKMIIEEGGGGNTGTTDVVAYLKKVPTEGGAVLLQNNTIKDMTPDEFRAAPKAK